MRPLGVYEYQCGVVDDYIRSPETDSCFVPFASGISGDTGLIDNYDLYGPRTVLFTNIETSFISVLPGTIVTCFGKTSGRYTAELKSSSTTYILDGYGYIYDAIELDSPDPNKPAGGDSGGPVGLITNSSTSPEKMTIYGMVSASRVEGTHSIFHATKILNILSGLKLVSFSGENR